MITTRAKNKMNSNEVKIIAERRVGLIPRETLRLQFAFQHCSDAPSHHNTDLNGARGCGRDVLAGHGERCAGRRLRGPRSAEAPAASPVRHCRPEKPAKLLRLHFPAF